MPSGEVIARAKPAREAVDWVALRERLEAVREKIENAGAPDAAQARKILQDRAKALAREDAPDTQQGEAIEVVAFQLAYERYAFESRYIREVCVVDSLCPLPGTPSFVLGVVNLRGQIVSVIDIRRFFGLPAKGLTDLNKLILLEDGPMGFGVLADAIDGVQTVYSRRLQPTLPTLKDVREKYLKGVTPDRTTLLDAAKLLHDPDIVVRQAAGTP